MDSVTECNLGWNASSARVVGGLLHNSECPEGNNDNGGGKAVVSASGGAVRPAKGWIRAGRLLLLVNQSSQQHLVGQDSLSGFISERERQQESARERER